MQQAVVGVKFKEFGKVYSFNPNGLKLSVGDKVIVDTNNGLSFGIIETAETLVDESKINGELKNVLRIATEKDLKQNERNIEKEKEALKITQEEIDALKLDMKLVSAEYNFDASKVIINFLSDNRVDFRDLVKTLAVKLKARIELRQIGIRDQARLVGGIGMCGRPCCCSTFLNDFEKVSIKMAKTQGLSLNPTKISGLCGRLLCCLDYENEYYSEVNKIMPKLNAEVVTNEGSGVVVYTNALKQIASVKITASDGSYTIKDFDFKDLKIQKPNTNDNNKQNTPKDKKGNKK